MGLDIHLYTRLNKIEGARRDADTDEIFVPGSTEALDYDRYIRISEPNFFSGTPRNEGLELDAYYTYEHHEHVFRRTYGGYNMWREELAKLAGYTPATYEQYGRQVSSYAAACWDLVDGTHAETGPFSELINFSDCEGVIGPVVSAKLAKDFEDFMEKAEAIGDLWFEGYKQLAAAFKRAGEENGAVRFS